jgi:succinate dehydrogenase hydrophobic anchor subunit
VGIRTQSHRWHRAGRVPVPAPGRVEYTLARTGGWNAFVSLARQPYFLALDVILLAGILIHGLNGLRVALTGFDVGVKQQKALFGVLMLVAVVALSAAALKIFGG